MTAAGTVLGLGRQARTAVLLALARFLTPVAADALIRARGLESKWAGFGGLSPCAGELGAFLAGPWTEAMGPLVHCLVEAAPSGDAARLTHVLDCIAKIMAAARGLETEATALAASALAIDGLTDGLCGQTELAALAVTGEDVGLVELWGTYTVDAEREVHENLLRKLAG